MSDPVIRIACQIQTITQLLQEKGILTADEINNRFLEVLKFNGIKVKDK